MKGYIIRRIAYAVIVLYLIATLNFLLLDVFSPLDPTAMFMDTAMRKETYEQMRKLWGVDRPVTERYQKYLVNMFTLQFGVSFAGFRSVREEIAMRLPYTILLMGTSTVIMIILGLLVGILAAAKRGSKIDMLAISAGLFAYGAPIFFVQMLLLTVFNRFLGWFPWGMLVTPGARPEGLALVIEVIHHMTLPVASLVLGGLGSWAIFTRVQMLDILTQDYIVTARAKGLKERTVLFSHALRSILPPVVTGVAMRLAFILTGSVVTEYIFTWPGIGQYLVASLLNNDYPAAQAVLFIFAIIMLGANFIADMLYGFLDPRIRVGMRR